ncbi:hypothetical protein DRW03_35400 [Corallococcus sp. H22C18031201]|uniref:hypothetical protein n=1 Tax=Citreicoccus inhibens TaxID=2849499 RepID=UPI000E70A0F2|nr:hypothetical protein [Citreicoccus inhibens]MBU8900641.1 hypothetical protein [Citreicoccus inhibens]RJS14130.1 hypothetical protein DRW03_35400 [Corallococcus sp. H22C18031201]
MDFIAFDIVDDDVPHRLGLRIRINERQLIDLVRAFEHPMAMREGRPNIAGAYTWLACSEDRRHPALDFYAPPAAKDDAHADRISVLTCGDCGEPGCWPLVCRIEVRRDQVVWRDFANPHRGPNSAAGEWSYEGFGPFVFERQAYEKALQPLIAER